LRAPGLESRSKEGKDGEVNQGLVVRKRQPYMSRQRIIIVFSEKAYSAIAVNYF
jgi:hypothetical protein